MLGRLYLHLLSSFGQPQPGLLCNITPKLVLTPHFQFKLPHNLLVIFLEDTDTTLELLILVPQVINLALLLFITLLLLYALGVHRSLSCITLLDAPGALFVTHLSWSVTHPVLS